jgi:hypothetical protein
VSASYVLTMFRHPEALVHEAVDSVATQRGQAPDLARESPEQEYGDWNVQGQQPLVIRGGEAETTLECKGNHDGYAGTERRRSERQGAQ